MDWNYITGTLSENSPWYISFVYLMMSYISVPVQAADCVIDILYIYHHQRHTVIVFWHITFYYQFLVIQNALGIA